MCIELKIKSKHLALEAGVIRFEEKKLKKQIKWSKGKGLDTKSIDTLNSIARHRKWDVRNENRATFLARAFLAGKPYSLYEKKRSPDREVMFRSYVLPRVLAMVVKYGPLSRRYKNQVTIQELVDWSKLSE